LDILANRNAYVKPKDDFKEKHRHYHDFFVDRNLLLKNSPNTTSINAVSILYKNISG